MFHFSYALDQEPPHETEDALSRALPDRHGAGATLTMATILAHIQIHAGLERDFEALIRELHAGTMREPGKRHYEYWRSASPGLYYCLLAFDDFHAFLAHQGSDHHERAAPRLGELIEKMRLEWLDPVQGASDLPPTETQPLPDAADELTTRYHRLFTPELQAWWSSLREA